VRLVSQDAGSNRFTAITHRGAETPPLACAYSRGHLIRKTLRKACGAAGTALDMITRKRARIPRAEVRRQP
jgi:hypothetical protein